MNWDFAIPRLRIGVALPVVDVPTTVMDAEAFAGFYERSARGLWAYLARVSGDATLADDLMQEAFLRFLGAVPGAGSVGDGEVACRRYLFRIGTNLLKDHWRRPRTSSMDEVPEALLAESGFHSGAGADARDVLGPALARMKPRERQLLWLAHAEGYAHGEIAEITGLQSASIRLLVFRARRRIARVIREQELGASVDVRSGARGAV